jgi:hypothetical protein
MYVCLIVCLYEYFVCFFVSCLFYNPDYGRGLKTKHQQVVLRLNKVNGRVDVGGITI